MSRLGLGSIKVGYGSRPFALVDSVQGMFRRTSAVNRSRNRHLAELDLPSGNPSSKRDHDQNAVNCPHGRVLLCPAPKRGPVPTFQDMFQTRPRRYWRVADTAFAPRGLWVAWAYGWGGKEGFGCGTVG